MHCIFCHKESSNSKSIEHIIPESLGNKHYFLPQGYVCDQCNNYFAVKIEKELLAQPYFVSLRSRCEISTKKGKDVKQKAIFPDLSTNAEVVIKTTENGLIIHIDENEVELYENIKAKGIKQICIPYIYEPEYPNIIMSRFLAKCAYEYFLYQFSEENYNKCAQELLSKENDLLKRLREYARYGKGEFWHYHQQRIYSEGYLVYNTKKNIIEERLFEMMFFIKNHEEQADDIVDAEIYFIVDIFGIEYAICLSDPQINEYKEWRRLNVHSPLEDSAHSPLEDNIRIKFPSDLSDLNPLLIKKQ
ncbi:MAG: hypothetical protein J6Y22_08145 [Paludibacteraceae bacterium]|nr:hypothetical protein [Paludibacteraceae bacterium]